MTRLLLLIAKGVIGILRTTFTSKASIALADELERELKELTSGLPLSADVEHAVNMLPKLVKQLEKLTQVVEDEYPSNHPCYEEAVAGRALLAEANNPTT